MDEAQSASSFYGSLFPRTRRGPSLPPIYAAAGGRSEAAKTADARLRSAASFSQLLDVLQEGLVHFDEGSLVIAFCTGAKLADDRSLSGQPAWEALQERLLQVVASLEPRGLSMVAYASAKLAWREEALLLDLASESTKKAVQFGPTDIAKICWAFTKLDMVKQVPDFWTAMGASVQRKVHEARPVDLSMIAWAFGMAECGSPAMCMEISSTALRLMQDLTPQCLANIALVFARLQVKDSELFTAIARRGLAQVHDFADFDVTSLCWAMARADVVDFELFDKLANHTVSCHFVKRYSAEMAAQMAWAFAVARVAHEPLFAELSDFIARHASVFEAQYIANCAWAYAVLDVSNPCAWQAMARECKGGRLWRYRPDELCAVCWGFGKIRLEDEALVGDMAQVASHRISELDVQCLINLLSGLVVLCEPRGILGSAKADEQDVEHSSGNFEHKEELTSLLGSGLSELSEKMLQPEELASAVHLFCKVGRLEDACRLCCRSAPDIAAWSALLAAAERSHALLAAQLWGRLAEAIPEPFATAARRCSQTRQSSCRSCAEDAEIAESAAAASAIHAVLPTPLDASESLQLLAELLRIAEDGAGAPSVLATGRGALLAGLARSPQFVLDIRGGVNALALAMAVRCPVWCLEGSAPAAAALRSCAAAWAPNLEVHLGPVEYLMEKALQRRGSGCVDLLVLHGGGEAQLEDLRRTENLCLLSPGCQLLSVGVLLPGAPRLLWQLHMHTGYDLEIFEVPELGVHPSKGWLASCRCWAAGQAQEVSELAALKAESEWLHVSLQTQRMEHFAERLRCFLEDHGLRPKTLNTGLFVEAPAAHPEAAGDGNANDDGRQRSLRSFADEDAGTRAAERSALQPAQLVPDLRSQTATEETCGRHPNLRQLPFADWLAGIDTSGELLCYLPVVQECYDTVAQIAQTYTVMDKDSNHKILDTLFFQDLGIIEAHRPLFKRWFVEVCGVQEDDLRLG